MRLIIDGRRLTAERTGVGRYLESLLADWAETGMPFPETRLLLHHPSGKGRIPSASGLSAEVVGSRLPGLAWERWGLGRRLRERDLLFAPTNLLPPTWRGASVLVVFDTLQEVRPRDFSLRSRWRYRRAYRRSARKAGTILVPSEETAENVRRFFGVDPRRIHVVHPAPEPSFRPLAPDSEAVRSIRDRWGLGDDPYFLFLGKRSARRNIGATIDAFRRVRSSHPRLRLVFAGPRNPPLPVIPEDGGVVEIGHVSEVALRGLLGGATALLYPSEHEGFGLPIVEAMASGCPVVTSGSGAIREAAGEAAVFLAANDADAIGEAMLRLLSDAEFRDDRRRSGLAHVATWSRRAFADRIKAILVEVGERIS